MRNKLGVLSVAALAILVTEQLADAQRFQDEEATFITTDCSVEATDHFSALWVTKEVHMCFVELMKSNQHLTGSNHSGSIHADRQHGILLVVLEVCNSQNAWWIRCKSVVKKMSWTCLVLWRKWWSCTLVAGELVYELNESSRDSFFLFTAWDALFTTRWWSLAWWLFLLGLDLGRIAVRRFHGSRCKTDLVKTD